DVLDIELLAEFSREFLGDEPGKHVGRSARRERNDQAHRSRRIGLRKSRAPHCRPRGSARDEMQEPAAWAPHGCSTLRGRSNERLHSFSARALARRTFFPPGSTAWMNCPPREPFRNG